jgi:hypothetical protein
MVLRVDHFFETEVVVTLLQCVKGDLLVVLGEDRCLGLGLLVSICSGGFVLLLLIHVDHRHFWEFVGVLGVVLLWNCVDHN